METRTPDEILEYVGGVGITKTRRKLPSVLILAFLAGAFIAIASQGSTMAAHNLFAKPETYGLGRAMAGAIFGIGLMMVVLAGGELFTGNMLIIVAVLDRTVTVRQMLRNWALVYTGNFLGSLLVAWMIYAAGLFNSSDNMLGGITIKIAAGKTGLPFYAVFLLGVLCNWLVCLAVWISYGTRETAGKALVIFFIIGLCITSAFEHAIANMYYIPAGIMAARNPAWLAAAGLSADGLANLSWYGFIVKNLIPATLGNIVGGAGMVGLLYKLSLGKNKAG